MANLRRNLRKTYWYFSGFYASKKYPINKKNIYVGITGTDGKTTTASFLYEIAKAYGYKPLLLSTVSAKFEDQDIKTNLKSTSFFAYTIKNILKSLLNLNIKSFIKNIFFLDKKGFAEHSESHRTTPLAAEIRKLVREYETKGANFFILETTSHALDQYRVYGIEFDSIAYTNITNEHLDYHGSWENYANTKAKLISMLKPGGSVALNKDDEKSYQHLSSIIEKAKEKKNIKKIVYQRITEVDPKDFWVHVAKSDKEGKELLITTEEKKLNNASYHSQINIFGNYNISNGLAAFSCFIGLKDIKKYQNAANALGNLHDVKGRMNFISEKPTIIVDFAHTPNAMEKALEASQKLLKSKVIQIASSEENISDLKSAGRLWVVFGCAGLRDNFKRKDMGRIAYRYADTILVTSEDPRTESLYQINNEIISGCREMGEEFTINTFYDGLKYEPAENEKYIVRFDEPNLNSRRNAISFALSNAKEEDVVIILGKGHETTMCFGDKELEWNDIDYVNETLKK